MEQKAYFERVDEAYETLTGDALEQSLRALAEQCGAEYGTDSPLYASMRSELGGFYRGERNFPASEREFHAALEIFRAYEGARGPDYATVLNNLAGTHRLMGDYDAAEAEFAECLSLYRDSLGEEHILYASGLNNLSLVYLDRGELTRAAELLEQASAILERWPDSLDEYATSLCNLGNLHRKLGSADKAETELRRAAELYETRLGIRTPHYHAILNTLGLIFFDTGRYAEAVDAFGKTAEAAETLYGAAHQETLIARKNLRRAEAAAQ